MPIKIFLLLFVVTLYPLVNSAQAPLLNKKITIAFNGISLANNIEHKQSLIIINQVIDKILKGLESKYAYEFINSPDSNNIPFSIHSSFNPDYNVYFNISKDLQSGNDFWGALHTMGAGEFNYTSKIRILDNKDGNVVITERMLWKDLLTLSSDTNRLSADLYKMFSKVFKLIAVPISTILPPHNKDQKLPSISIIHFISSDNPELDHQAKIITGLLNNILVFHQANFYYNYYPGYNHQAIGKEILGLTITGKFSERSDGRNYTLILEYNNDGLNKTYKSNSIIRSVFQFNKNRIDHNDYIGVISKLNRSMYHFLQDHFQKIITEPYTIGE